MTTATCGNCGWTGPHTCKPASVRNLHLDIAAGRIGVEVLVEVIDELAKAVLSQTYKPEGVDVWWAAHEGENPVERAVLALATTGMTAT